MTRLETNIYSITNLGDLSARYRLAEVAGLRPDQAEYFQNRQTLERRLSYSLKKPVLVVERDGIPFVVVPEEVALLPAEVELVRVVVQLRLRDERLDLDYSKRGSDDPIALRFLRFLIQAPLGRDARLWQPQSGYPFFERAPARPDRGIHRYAGFSVRPVVTPDAGIGLCVDVHHCYVSAQPLPAELGRNEFATRWKGRNCIYHFAQDWYEIRLHALADRNAQEYRFHTKGRTWSLLDYILDHARRPLPADLGSLPANSATVLYRNNRGTEAAAPAPLCYPVFRTDSEEVARQHGRTILPPPAAPEPDPDLRGPAPPRAPIREHPGVHLRRSTVHAAPRLRVARPRIRQQHRPVRSWHFRSCSGQTQRLRPSTARAPQESCCGLPRISAARSPVFRPATERPMIRSARGSLRTSPGLSTSSSRSPAATSPSS